MLKVSSLILTGILLSGCAKECMPHKEFVTKEVYVPIMVDLPEVDCEFNAPDIDGVIDKMLECIKDQKKVIEIYSNSIKDYNAMGEKNGK